MQRRVGGGCDKVLMLCTVLEIAENNLIHAFSCEIQVVRHFKAACLTMFRGLPWCNKQCWDTRTSLRLSSHSSSFLCSSRGLVERHTCSGCHEFFFSLLHCDGGCTCGGLHSSCDTSNFPNASVQMSVTEPISTAWRNQNGDVDAAPLLQFLHWARLRPLPARTGL